MENTRESSRRCMKKIILYIATSVDGKIAQSDGSVDWLETIPNPDKIDYGYYNFINSIDTTIQGYSTYQQIIDWDIEFPYKGKINYVLTRKKNITNTEYVRFVNDKHVEFIEELKKKEGKDIWLIGGGQVNTLLLNANLIDEIHQFIMPIVLGKGIDIFELETCETILNNVDTKLYSNGVVRYKYEL